MLVTRCYKFRLEPTIEQEQEFYRFAGCRRFVWNWALERKNAVYKETGQGIYYFVNFFEGRARLPRFKSRRRTPNAFRIPQNVSVVDGADSQYAADSPGALATARSARVSIPKIGLVKVRLHRLMEGTIKGATIKQEPSGHWNVTFVSHLELPDAPATCDAPTGIDVGLESFLTLNNGHKVKPPKFYRKAQRKLRRAQRKLSRCKNNSKSRQKARKQVTRCHTKVRNQRNDWLHKLSAQLVRLFDTLCIETLNLSGLVRTKLAKSFSDAALGTFLRMLEYKVVPRYGQVVKVGRFFASSKTCSNPECRHKQHLELSDRTWICERCQTLHDRDINAAINILHEGLRILALGMRESLNADGENVRLTEVSYSR